MEPNLLAEENWGGVAMQKKKENTGPLEAEEGDIYAKQRGEPQQENLRIGKRLAGSSNPPEREERM